MVITTTGNARFSDPQTSHDAANNVDAAKLERLVVGCIQEHGPVASDKVSQILGIDLQSVSPRFRPLANRGLIKQHMVNGNPATVKSLTSNRQRMMWVGCAGKEGWGRRRDTGLGSLKDEAEKFNDGRDDDAER